MYNSMIFPATVDEFMEEYKVVDSEHVYSNGMEMVPIFRMKQWFEHEANHNAEPGKMVEDCISRQVATTIPVMPKEHRHYQTNNLDDAYEQGWTDLQECIENLPPVQPKHGKWIPVTNGRGGHECDQCHNYAPSYQNGKEHLSGFCPHCGAKMEG